jgi:hypothetical protein
MPSAVPAPDHSTDHPLYTKAELVGLRRTMLLYCRSFPPGFERNQHRLVARSIRSLFRSKQWLDTHTVEGSGRRRDRDLTRLCSAKGASPIP